MECNLLINLIQDSDRAFVRTEETNLGNLTADANLAYVKTVDLTTVISLLDEPVGIIEILSN